MQPAVGLLALVWLVGSMLLMSRTVRRGRALAETLAGRHPATYEALGRPYPGYLESVRRTRFARFVGHREFESLPDPVLSAQFETYRMQEARLVISILPVAVLGWVSSSIRASGEGDD